jgi:hypothetical protein
MVDRSRSIEHKAEQATQVARPQLDLPITSTRNLGVTEKGGDKLLWRLHQALGSSEGFYSPTER